MREEKFQYRFLYMFVFFIYTIVGVILPPYSLILFIPGYPLILLSVALAFNLKSKLSSVLGVLGLILSIYSVVMMTQMFFWAIYNDISFVQGVGGLILFFMSLSGLIMMNAMLIRQQKEMARNKKVETWKNNQSIKGAPKELFCSSCGTKNISPKTFCFACGSEFDNPEMYEEQQIVIN